MGVDWTSRSRRLALATFYMCYVYLSNLNKVVTIIAVIVAA